MPELSFNFFDSKDIVRHPVVAKIVQAYDIWETEDEIRQQALKEERKAQRELARLKAEQQKIWDEAKEL